MTDHSYQHMYEKYLPAIRNKSIKKLEIGLGCDMVSSLRIFIPIIPCEMLLVGMLPVVSARHVFPVFVAPAPPSLTPIRTELRARCLLLHVAGILPQRGLILHGVQCQVR